MAINDDIILLKKFDFFNKMTPEQLRLLIFGAERQEFASGEMIFKEGELAESAYVVLSGTVNLYRQNNNSGQPIEIINRNALINELALVTEINRPFTAIAQSNSKVLEIERTVFLRLIKEFPDITRYIYDYVNERIHELANNINRMSELK
ncbi:MULTISPECIES: cyclic nucleotide-binding domain-containing protein [Bartonella]|uniref:cyclic nucleotide-binding domain-containing protein n=1 Tax=Bartonella TaxID=773 RepID=UPI0018DB53D9|nr:cyclic nucleotide-binding domain-containing protein [Bartonella sp. P0291]MBH9996184.1 cyclic nucleotide-binding domain-containing protein [Bartonella sp. M0192]MBH9998345.1 cyclic nucleotide-binding domain-containing protein [Bartonella sp. M0191]MBI0009056.1 cyclic nucleotide-binding domain-containing protein [Bartonella sp. M0193]MBI0009635.1 cyclic nucleotide-binding domain-containing protein [Bartonella sp. M0176]MBI0013245.1 cyclic nucleotide-binding domain-containing protein [Bartone